MITKENHEAIELLVASINQIQANAKGAGLLAICSITIYSAEPEARLMVYPAKGVNLDNITEAKLNITSYDTIAADLCRIDSAIAIHKHGGANERRFKLEKERKELAERLEEIEFELKDMSNGEEAK